MIVYPLPLELTREQFHSLVTDLYYKLMKNGLDPSLNMVMGDQDEVLDDGTTTSQFAIWISESAAKILEHKGH
jgi:hypothetical protein